MRELPTGTVTFLFTDIEGSTELLTALGDGYRVALERHNELLRSAFKRHDGVDLMSQGDSLFAVFPSASEAILAAVEAQRSLAAEPWPVGHEITVRIGLHTGEGVLGGDSYVGLDVHRAARISSAAHGGQVLVSDATRALAEGRLGDRVGWIDLGRHRLKGLPEPEHIYQLTAPGLAADFAPIKSLEAHPNNLPHSMTSFIGRDEEVSDLRQLLGQTRLLTLTGPGGTGKTRLGIRVAEELVPDYDDGCWFVGLDALRDPELVPVTIADALHVKVAPDQPAMASLQAHLADRQMLLVLDNFEQVAPAGVGVAELLRSTAKVRILATSRVPLHVYGEREYPVPPLDDEAVQLFVERATAVRPDFRLTDANAADVSAICQRLDGLPLAIELAAARVKLLTPQQILARLGERLSLLATASADLPERQRTLRGAIDWSFNLLAPDEQRLFGALAVFRGGFTLEAAESVLAAADSGFDVLDGIGSLVDKSLVRVDSTNAETRYAMLETIREYAVEHLDALDARQQLLIAHARHYFRLAGDAGAQLMSSEQSVWLDRLDRDADNLRAAFSRAPDIGLLDQAMRSAGAIWRYWQLRAHFAEGRTVFERLLEHSGASDAAREQALTGAGGITYWQADTEATAAYYNEALELAERIGNPAILAEALSNAAYVPVIHGDWAAARPLLERSSRLYRELDQDLAALDVEAFLGWTYFMLGEPVSAMKVFAHAVDAYRAAGAQWQLADNLSGLAFVHAASGRWAEALAAMMESMAIFAELHNEVGIAQDLDAVSAMAAWLGDLERSARLTGRALAIVAQAGGGGVSQALFYTQPFHAKARRALGDDRYDELLAEGEAMATADAVELASQLPIAAEYPPLQMRPDLD